MIQYSKIENLFKLPKVLRRLRPDYPCSVVIFGSKGG